MKIALLMLGLATSSYAALMPVSDSDFVASLSAVTAPENAKFVVPLGIADIKARAVSNSELMSYLNDADAKVRLSGLRVAREHVSAMSICDKIISMAADIKEQKAVRIEAAKTLSFSNFNKTEAALMALVKNGDDSDIRAQAAKALYRAAQFNNDAREFLTETAVTEKNLQVRIGAIWGLFKSVHSDTRKTLHTIMLNPAEDAAVRVEAIRSLYTLRVSAASDAETIAEDVAAAQAVRVAAVHLLAAAGRMNDVRKLAKNDPDPVVRAAAITVISFGQADFEKYFHIAHDDYSVPNPIDM